MYLLMSSPQTSFDQMNVFALLVFSFLSAARHGNLVVLVAKVMLVNYIKTICQNKNYVVTKLPPISMEDNLEIVLFFFFF